MKPGHQPPEVLDVAAVAAAAEASVESRQIDIVRGVPVVIIRYAIEPLGDAAERAAALQVAYAIRFAVEQIASTSGLTVTRRVGGRWLAA